MSLWKKTIMLLTIFALLISFSGIALTTDAAGAEYNEAAMKEKLAKAHRVLAMNGHDDWLCVTYVVAKNINMQLMYHDLAPTDKYIKNQFGDYRGIYQFYTNFRF